MKKVMIIFLTTILILTTVLAANSTANLQQAQIKKEIMIRTQERVSDLRELNEEKIGNLRERIQNQEEVMLNKRNLTLKRIDDKILEIREKERRIQTRLNLSTEGNGSQIRARLSNGRNAEIKIMPETASARAIQRLKLKVCSEQNNCSIELKEVRQGNRTRLAYEAKARKTFRILGLFKARREIQTQIDAETGEEIQTRRPWWSFLATEKEE